MKRYSAYKQTEYDWLPEVPEHWIKKSIRAITKPSDRRNGDRTDLELLSLYRDYGLIPKSSRDDNHNVESADLSKYRHVKKHNLVINKMKAWQGSLGISDYEGIVSPAYIVCDVVDTVHSLYFHHLLRSKPFKTFYNRISYGVRVGQWDINYTDFKTLCVYLPPLEEQKAIADFLDKKTKQIDRFISLQKEAISLLKELRQAEITKAVTKGLDENAEMKDSGVEWIGEISSNYTVRRLKYLLNEPLMYGANETGISYDVTLPRYIRITDITLDGKLKGGDKLSLSEDIAYPYLLKNNDVLFARSGGTVGKAFIYKSEYGRSAFAGYLIKASTNEHLLPDYLYYYTQSSLYEEWKNQVFILATIQNIGADKYGNLPIIWQPINEQQKHVDYLNKKCAEIDSAIQNKEALIEKVTEYKTRLISDAVTGNIDVRN